ncbi:MAG: Tad domain-containing protein [Candidatus Thiodiazotropha endolucinida]
MNSKTINRESGQALPLGIAFLMSTILLGLVLFNTGQTASERSRLINTADAAVYSGLVWQARALNFQAYTNRAMVANQVSIGQLVSLTSWTQYAYILARNIDSILDYFPIDELSIEAAEIITETIDDVAVNIAETFIPIIDSINGMLSRTQQAVYVASFAATPAIVREVVEENDERYNTNTAYAVIGLGENALGWQNLVRRYDDEDGLLRKADVVNRSKDEFTNARNLGTSQLIPNAPDVLNLGITRLWLRKEGRTNLVSDAQDGSMQWEWKGKDTFSLHREDLEFTRRGPRWVHRELPLGWGSRHVNGDFECEEGQDRSRWWSWRYSDDGCPRYTQQNRRAEMIANLSQEALDAEYNGIRAYNDLRNLSRQNGDPRLALRLEVELPQSDVRTASKIDGLGSDSVPEDELRSGMGEGMFGTEDQMAGEGMAIIASGELFFHPPDDYVPARRRGRYEIASLFSPYWEVRLTDTPLERRFMAWTLRDENLLTEGASGISSGVEHYIHEREEELARLRGLEQSLQDQLNDTIDVTRRAELETELVAVGSQITHLESTSGNALMLTDGLQQEMAQGVSEAAQIQVGQYEHMLQEYAEQEGEEIVDQFEDEVVDQITDQMQQTLEAAAEEAVESTLNSIIIIN